MSDIERVSPRIVREKVQSGNTQLVGAYDDDSNHRRLHLDSSISLREFKSEVSGIAKDREIIFYCA